MRPHGHYYVDAKSPRALGTCDFCGKIYNHEVLRWNYQWAGPKLQNTRMLVCPGCIDVPQQQLRTIILPPDPVPIQNARPESYVVDFNPMSGIGASPNFENQLNSAFIGNITGGVGIAAAFDGNLFKVTDMSAQSPTVSNSSFDNYIGMNWSGVTSIVPSSVNAPAIRHTLTSFSLYAPQDRSFLPAATDYLVQSSPSGGSDFSEWTTLSSGTTAGTAGEIVTAQCAAGDLCQFHRVAFAGDATNPVVVAQVQFNVGQVGEAIIP